MVNTVFATFVAFGTAIAAHLGTHVTVATASTAADFGCRMCNNWKGNHAVVVGYFGQCVSNALLLLVLYAPKNMRAVLVHTAGGVW